MNVFISHSWDYSGHYDRLAEWIFVENWETNGVRVNFFNTSVPRDDPIHNAPNAAALKTAIYYRIVNSDVVVIPTGMYVNRSDWIQKEIDGARLYAKPILAVNLWGQQRASSVVRSVAARSVGWSKQSIVDAVWQLGNRLLP